VCEASADDTGIRTTKMNLSAPNPVKPLTLNFVLRHDFTIITIAVGNFFSKLLFQTLRMTSLEIGSWTDVQTQAEPY
jgi:hypothetical protein